MQASPPEQLPLLTSPADLCSNVQPIDDMLHSSQDTLLQLCPLQAAPAMIKSAELAETSLSGWKPASNCNTMLLGSAKSSFLHKGAAQVVQTPHLEASIPLVSDAGEGIVSSTQVLVRSLSNRCAACARPADVQGTVMV